VHRAL